MLGGLFLFYDRWVRKEYKIRNMRNNGTIFVAIQNIRI